MNDRLVHEFEPGDRVVVRGRALFSMGLCVGELGAVVFTVEACACNLCGLGRHVAVQEGRHFARAALRGVDELCVDELRGVDSDALTAGIQAGIGRASREPRASKRKDGSRPYHE